MARLQAWALMIVLSFITNQPVICEEIFHIIPSADSPCPGELTGEPCITLDQYSRGEYRQYTSDDPSEITLEFQPGRHTLRSYGSTNADTFASQLVSFTMNSANSTEIICDCYYRHLITNVRNVRVNGINFMHCNLMIESVMNFILKESSFFQSCFYFNDVLYILHTSSATIRGCNFTNHNRLPLHIDNSSIELHHTTFANNTLGALFVENVQSIITISHCNFIDNSAQSSGGAARIRGATISILNSTFSRNRVAESGGVFAIDDSEMTIQRSTFDNNTAGANGGVIAIEYFRSSLFISDTSFTNNQADNQGGVMYLRRKGSQAKIRRSDISSNNATRGGFATVHGSSLEIFTTYIFNNTAEVGEVISACNSNISISDQLFTATDPVYSVCTLVSGNINDTFDFEATTTPTKAPVNTTSTTDIPAISSGPSSATTTMNTRAITSYVTEPRMMPSVYFQLNNKLYPNNSVISLSDVGENEQALMCKTDLSICCASPPNRFGEFYYPSGDIVLVKKAGHDFYRDRGAQEVRLNRREGVTSPSGKFRCAVPDASGTIQNLFIHLL